MRSIILMTISILFFICYKVQAQYDVYDSDKFFQEAETLVSQEKYDAAISMYQNVHPSDPQFLEAQLQISYIHIYEEEYQKAIDLLKPLYDEGKFKEEPQLYVSLGSAYSDDDKLEEAEKIYLEGEKVTPDYGTLMYNMAVLYNKKEDLDKTIYYLKRTMSTNPNISSAHYLLSSLAFDNGKLGLGSLAAAAYLANSPESRYSGDAILMLNNKMGSHYLNETKAKFSERGDDFSKLDFILRSEFPLDRKYKLNCDIDDVYTRNLQAVVDYSADHKLGDGFFENIYIPYLADIKAKGLTENYLYWTMSALTGEIGKKIMKNKKLIIDYNENYYQKEFWSIYAKRKQEHFGETKEVVYYLSDNIPYLISALKNDELEGIGKYVDKYGRLSGKVNYIQSKATGKAEYFDGEERVTEDRIYKDGEVNGKNNFYDLNGNKIAEYDYINGEIDGEVKSYFASGDVMCKVNYKGGKLNGSYACNYPNGQVKFDANYKDNKLDGEKTTYALDGTLTSKEYYKNDLYDGTSTYFNTLNGEELGTVKYTDGEVKTSYKRKDNNGDISYEYLVNGDLIESKNYLNNELQSIYYYKGEEPLKYEFFDKDKIYLEYNFKKGKLTDLIQYTEKLPKGKKLNQSLFDVHGYYDGTRYSTQKMKDGKLHGLSKYYWANANKKSEINYKNGNEDGHTKIYDKHGSLIREYDIRNDSLNGLFITYWNGKISSEYNYKDGMAHGPYKTYKRNGSLNYEGFYYNDEEIGNTKQYRTDGSIMEETKYDEGDRESTTYFDSTEKVFDEVSYTENGQKTINYKTAPFVDKYSIKNKSFHGPYTRTSSNGDKMFEINMVNGKRSGECKYYSPYGKLQSHLNQKESKNNGECIYYDHLGNIYAISTNLDGDEYGPEKYYYPNGKMRLQHNNIEDEVDGEQIIYNMDEEPVAKLVYESGLVKEYWVIGQDEYKKVTKTKMTIEGKYPNGNTAINLTLNKMYYDGLLQIFSQSKTPCYTANYKNGLLDGPRIFYRANGQEFEKTTYVQNYRNGTTTYFNENNKKVIEYQSEYGDYNGEYKIYKDGNLTTTKIFIDDELVEIK